MKRAAKLACQLNTKNFGMKNKFMVTEENNNNPILFELQSYV